MFPTQGFKFLSGQAPIHQKSQYHHCSSSDDRIIEPCAVIVMPTAIFGCYKRTFLTVKLVFCSGFASLLLVHFFCSLRDFYIPLVPSSPRTNGKSFGCAGGASGSFHWYEAELEHCPLLPSATAVPPTSLELNL